MGEFHFDPCQKIVNGAKMAKIAVFGLFGGHRGPKMTFLPGKNVELPQHTLILTFMVEFDFNQAKKVVNWVSNWLK